MTSPALQLEDVSLSFGSSSVLDHVSFTVEDASITALMGPSGCGKTTVLRCIAGFERPSSGSIRLRDVTITDREVFVPAHRRRIGYVPQDGALFPHLDVTGNVGFGLDRSADRRVRVEECLEMVGLGGFGARRVDQLSGGQQQRVALARALAPRPDLVLMDEPFSSLDAALRPAVCADVVAALRDAGATAVIVTHDRDEALAVADHLVVMLDGHIAQSGGPATVCRAPATPEVARLLGRVEVVSGTSDGSRVTTDGAVIDLDGGAIPTGPVDVVVRHGAAYAFPRSDTASTPD